MSEELNTVVQVPVADNDTQEIALFEDRSEVFLSNVKKAQLLTPALTEKITALAPEMFENFRTQTIWRTSTEIRCSVLNDMNFPD